MRNFYFLQFVFAFLLWTVFGSSNGAYGMEKDESEKAAAPALIHNLHQSKTLKEHYRKYLGVPVSSSSKTQQGSEGTHPHEKKKEAIKRNVINTLSQGESTKEETKKEFRILSLDGGGFRGLIQAILIQHLTSKEVANRAIPALFDLVAGTSIGGINGAAFVAQDAEKKQIFTPDEVVQLYTAHGDEIFPQRSKWNIFGRGYDAVTSLWWNRYSPDSLKKLLKSKFVTSTLSSAGTNFFVTTANATTQTPMVLSSMDTETNSVSFEGACLSTSAAPTYFPTHSLTLPSKKQTLQLMDGGLWVNNPASAAYQQAVKYWGDKVSRNKVVMLSLGTGLQPPGSIQPSNGGLLNSASAIVEGLMNISSSGIDAGMEELLKKGNYTRVNPELGEVINLDDIRPTTQNLLIKAAQSQFDKIERFYNTHLRLHLEGEEAF